MATPNPKSFAELLQSAVNEPGILSNPYRQFHNYSIGNQVLAWVQCLERGIQPGPLATYPRWKDLGRYVCRGEKAIVLCMPVTVKRPITKTVETDTGIEEVDGEATFTRFIYRPNWFVFAQTEGQPIPEPEIPKWDKDRALQTLGIAEVPFDETDGNCLGFARQRSIAINPVNPMPHKTRFHETAHILLGHTAEGMQADREITPLSLRECEAEAVALLCCAALELPGVQECRGYVQHWWGAGNPIPERSAQRIFKAADQILKAGTTDQGVSS
jgi:antirestriction protein ArdC